MRYHNVHDKKQRRKGCDPQGYQVAAVLVARRRIVAAA